MIVVSDTSCISNLVSIGHADILSKIFGEVVIPPAVQKELLQFHSKTPDFLKIASPSEHILLNRLSRELDAGEAEAICLAHELKADRLLIDEKLGRAVALREGVAIIGVLGVLILAKENKLISSVRELVDRLENKAGFRLSESIKAKALQAAGE